MKKTILLLLALSLSSLMATAQTSSFEQVNPRPQKISGIPKFAISWPQDIRIQASQSLRSTAAYHLLSRATAVSDKADLRVIMGVRGDKQIRAYERYIPQRSEGYYLSVGPKAIVLAGADEQGLYYAVQTLLQSVGSSGLISCGQVTDYPDVRWRGVVEGFYGTPWSHEARLGHLDFYGRNKLNVYIYGPKDDPYHSVPRWREPYPSKEAEQIRSLVARAQANAVTFYWAIHPGQDIKWNDEDLALLIGKLEHMYELGVRGFAVFFDDISGEGTKADKQAELLNYINREFVHKKGDVAPLVMCPTEYNKSWSRIEGGYLPTLGTQLDKDIEIMWTGNTVVATIDKSDMQWINGYIKRRAYIWFNFPVSDFVRNHLLLGATYGNSLEIAQDLSGFLSNPMEHAEASKIALYSVADYTWNMKAYDSHASWERAIKAVMPEHADALRTFAEHSSDLGPNGHRFRREESLRLKPLLERIASGHTEAGDLDRLLSECLALERSASILLASREQPRFISELSPWLRMARLIGRYGQEVVGLDRALSSDASAVVPTYQHIRSLLSHMYEIDTTENQNPYQPGVRLATRYLLPAIDSLFVRSIERYNAGATTKLSAQLRYTPCIVSSDVIQLSGLGLSTRGRSVSLSPANEVVRWKQGQSLTLSAQDQPLGLRSLELDLGMIGVAELFTLEALVDGQWLPLELRQEADKKRIRAEVSSLGGRPWTSLRLVQTGKPEVEVYFRSFRLDL